MSSHSSLTVAAVLKTRPASEDTRIRIAAVDTRLMASSPEHGSLRTVEMAGKATRKSVLKMGSKRRATTGWRRR